MSSPLEDAVLGAAVRELCEAAHAEGEEGWVFMVSFTADLGWSVLARRREVGPQYAEGGTENGLGQAFKALAERLRNETKEGADGSR